MKVTPVPDQPSRPVAEPQPRDMRAAVAARVPAWGTLLAAAGLLAIVALASRSTSGGGGLRAIDFGPAVTAVEVVGYVGLAVGLAALALSAAMWRRRRQRREVVRKVHRELGPVPWWANVLALVVVGGMVAIQVAVFIQFLAELQRLRGAPGQQGPGVAPGVDPNALGPAGRDLTAMTIALVIIIALAVISAVVLIRLRMQDDRTDPGPTGGRAHTMAAVELSLDALRAEPDPRRAVIKAYAAMEVSLSGAGLGRRRSEAPVEYLQRVLEAPTGTADELRTITSLFQHAKFSRHVVDEAMRGAAIGALERIRVAAGGQA
jgi:hypothetical protein